LMLYYKWEVLTVAKQRGFFRKSFKG
jgi:hypothetical protein